MEREYMFFHTGPAFCVAVVAAIASGILSVVALFLLPQVPLLQCVTALGICASIMWIPFWLDYRLLKKRRTGVK